MQGNMTVHYRKQCIAVDNIACFVPTHTKWNKFQPRVVMQGWAKKVIITKDKTAIIE
jgi:hypothetical protein